MGQNKLGGTFTRRGTLAAAAAGWAVAQTAWAQAPAETTAAIRTSSGRIRGHRVNGVSNFLGVPYGGDTSTRRFQPALPAPSWRGVRDCFSYGLSAPQPGQMRTATNAAANNYLAQLFAGVPGETPPPDGEECLYLNVYTPDASRARKRPVLFWLHGGGFAQGSGSTLNYEGGNLCRRGDVVVVTSNHRLNAMGYLYLGALHNDFADSGNVGQLDQILALQWVRDNIENFGGDPDNVTIFGESGGGSKVSTLMAMPSARGLFHKAIIQSGPGLRMVDRDSAAAHAERTLAGLNIPTNDVAQIRTKDFREIIAAANAASRGAGFGRSLAPVVDGRSLPRHPFDPDAPDTARNVPLIIGTCKDEANLFSVSEPWFGTLTEAQALERFQQTLGDRAQAGLDVFRHRAPNDAPTYWYTSMTTASGTWMNSIRLAERKLAQPAPVYMFRLDWETPVMEGRLKAPHGLDTALVFDNADRAPGILGTGPEPRAIGAAMSQAWINFARSTDPSIPGVAWPRYDTASRQTMIFLPQSRIQSDPDADVRRFFTA